MNQNPSSSDAVAFHSQIASEFHESYKADPNRLERIRVWRACLARHARPATLAYGLPVICSDLPVLHEVAGEGALFFDPTNDEMLADAIYRVMTDDALATRLSDSARQNAKRFSWERAAKETEAVFERLLP